MMTVQRKKASSNIRLLVCCSVTVFRSLFFSFKHKRIASGLKRFWKNKKIKSEFQFLMNQRRY